MGPMLFSWQNKCTERSVKMFKHKKRHEAQYATPADAEVIMKRLVILTPAYTIPNLFYLHPVGMSRKNMEKEKGIYTI